MQLKSIEIELKGQSVNLTVEEARELQELLSVFLDKAKTVAPDIGINPPWPQPTYVPPFGTPFMSTWTIPHNQLTPIV